MSDTSPTAVFYTVTAEIDDPGVASRYLSWLLGQGEFAESHVGLVLAWGGTVAVVSVLDADGAGAAGVPGGQAVRIECRYEFPDRAALDRYLAEGAPALREEGKRLFLDAGGVRMSRRIGALAARVRG